MLVLTVVVILVPWMMLSSAEPRRRLRWARFSTGVVLAESFSMVVIPYQLHVWRRSVFIAALVALAVGGFAVLLTPSPRNQTDPLTR
jgi:hypothetical protein